MQMFAHYDLQDSLGNRVADGHKASFCLEDVECMPRSVQKFVCRGMGDQGTRAFNDVANVGTKQIQQGPEPKVFRHA